MSEIVPIDPPITIRAETLLADPDTCKFTVSQSVYPGGPFFFDNKERAAGSPLVERLFALPGVAHVLVTENVVTVGKEPSASWPELKSAIGTAIRTQLLTGVPTILDTPDNRSFTGVLTSTRDQRSSKHEVRVEIKRDCEVTMIPRGEMLTLWKGDTVVVTQALGAGLGPEPHVRGRPTAARTVVRRRDDVDQDCRRDHDGRTSSRSAVERLRPPSPDCSGAFPGSHRTNRAVCLQ
jgi:hypothetical protein